MFILSIKKLNEIYISKRLTL